MGARREGKNDGVPAWWRKPVANVRSNEVDAFFMTGSGMPDVDGHAIKTGLRPRFEHYSGPVAETEDGTACLYKFADEQKRPFGKSRSAVYPSGNGLSCNAELGSKGRFPAGTKEGCARRF